MLKQAVLGAALALGGAGMAEPAEAAEPVFSFRIDLGDVTFGYSTGPQHSGPHHRGFGPMYHHQFRHGMGSPGIYVVAPRMPYMPQFHGSSAHRFSMPQYNPNGRSHGSRGLQHSRGHGRR